MIRKFQRLLFDSCQLLSNHPATRRLVRAESFTRPYSYGIHHAQSYTPRTRTLGQRRQVCRSFDLSDQRIRADRHSEPAHQALAGTSSQGMPTAAMIWPVRLVCCACGAQTLETLGEDSSLAMGVPATPATQMQPEDHLRALDRKVFRRTPIPAMARARDGLATRTAAEF
jgi:hypothetical protein